MQNNSIDFIVLWVDGNDISWQKKKASYMPGSSSDVSAARYRDWDNLRYWFRAVEKYAPWVRKVHFVTDGQVPEWMNTDCPKLHRVDHHDYIPQDALPLFNSSSIEIGLHNIPDLSDRFVYFNDDIFLTAPVTPDYFFHDGLPVDMAGLTRPGTGNSFFSMMNNNYQILNRYFERKDLLIRNFSKWFRPSYGKTFLRTLCNLGRPTIDGLIVPHMSVAYCKSDFQKVWDRFGEELSQTQHHRFREDTDLTQMVFRFWRMCEGTFYPRRSRGRYWNLDDMSVIKPVCDAIKKQTYPEICINDTWKDDGFEAAKQQIIDAFQSALSEKCQFEL